MQVLLANPESKLKFGDISEGLSGNLAVAGIFMFEMLHHYCHCTKFIFQPLQGIFHDYSVYLSQEKKN